MVRYVTYPLKKGQLIGAGPRHRRKPEIFVAYSFNVEHSQKFRDRLEHMIKRTPSMRQVNITDGRVPLGATWPTEIRKRLERARLVVVELSVLSPEVLFECGFAWGLNRPILPVTRSADHRAHLPNWLQELQFGHHSTDEGLYQVVHAISERLSEGRSGWPRHVVSKPSPNEVALIAHHDNRDIVECVQQFCSRYELSLSDLKFVSESLCDTGESFVSAVSRASLLIGCLSNKAVDNLVHFAAGMVCARPTAGIARSKLDRRVLLLIPGSDRPETLVAESARRVTKTVKITRESTLNLDLSSFAHSRSRWQKRQKVRYAD